MTRLLNQGQGELLRLLAQMPFLDRLGAGRPGAAGPGEAYTRRRADWRTPDSSPPCPTARRCWPPPGGTTLTEQGVNALDLEEVRPVDRLLREYPLSTRWRRVLLERLDTAAVIYRLASALVGLGHPVRFRWSRALPQDAAMVLPDGRVLAMVRQGTTAERAGFAKRLWRLAQGPRPGAVLVIVPDEVRLRQAVAMAARGPPSGPGLLRPGTARCGGQRRRHDLAVFCGRRPIPRRGRGPRQPRRSDGGGAAPGAGLHSLGHGPERRG